MGYTHYFSHGKFTKKEKDTVIPFLKDILKRYETILCNDEDARIEDDDGHWSENKDFVASEHPAVLTRRKLRFNGLPPDDNCETFCICFDRENNSDFSKTARSRYDAAVCECLLVLDAYVEHFHFTSSSIDFKSGELEPEWDNALNGVNDNYHLDARMTELLEPPESAVRFGLIYDPLPKIKKTKQRKLSQMTKLLPPAVFRRTRAIMKL